MDEKSYENILLNKISYKSLIDSKPLRVRFDKIDRIVKIYDGSRTFRGLSGDQHKN